MLANILLLGVTTVVALFITAIILMSRTVIGPAKLAFSLTSVNMALWNITIYIADNVKTHLVFWNHLVFLFPSIAAVGLLMFVSVLGSNISLIDSTKILKRSPISTGLLTVSVVTQLSAILSGQIFTSVTLTPAGEYVFKRGLMYLVYVLGVLLLLGLISTQLIRNYRHSDKHSQQKGALRVVMFTIIGVLGYGLTMNVIVPVATGSQRFISLGAFSLDIFSFGLALSIVRYRLFEIRFFVVRAVAYLTSVFAVTFIFIAPFIWVINHLLGGELSNGQFAFVVLLSVSLLYVLQYVRRIFDRITAKLFFRNDYEPQDVQDRLNDILVRTADLRDLRDETAKVLSNALRSSALRYLLTTSDTQKDAELLRKVKSYCDVRNLGFVVVDEICDDDDLARILREDGTALVIKLHTTHEDMGFMIVGHKQSGEQYSERDKRLLSAAADEIAISLQNVLRFEQIQQFNVTLQEEVETATRKLQRQNKRLEELDNIKDDFISMASHQLRTPLTSVKGYLSMVLEGDAGKLNETQAQMLKQAFTSSQRMVFLITDLLNVSRLKTGKFVIDAAPTNLSDVVQQELAQLHETAQVKDIKLVYDKPKSFPQLMLDEVKIRQVVMNFVDNAIYYTPPGGHIRVELEEKPAVVELRVVDDGIGVPKSEQHHLFTKFYRATNARKARPDGTGIGLFMAQKVITAQGGSIVFNSQENKGSTFGFTLSKSRLKVPDTGTGVQANSKGKVGQKASE